MHALTLKSLGYNVTILEARPGERMHAQAAGLSFWPKSQRLFKKYIPNVDLDSIAIRNTEMEIMDENGLLMLEVPVFDDVRTSSYAVVRNLLRKACEAEGPDLGKMSFLAGKKVYDVVEQDDLLKVAYRTEQGTEESILTELVIAADGAQSYIRSLILPEVKAEYSGYLAWRARMPEKHAPDELKGTLDGRLTSFILDGSYILA